MFISGSLMLIMLKFTLMPSVARISGMHFWGHQCDSTTLLNGKSRGHGTGNKLRSDDGPRTVRPGGSFSWSSTSTLDTTREHGLSAEH
jgi:hypothetical protein